MKEGIVKQTGHEMECNLLGVRIVRESIVHALTALRKMRITLAAFAFCTILSNDMANRVLNPSLLMMLELRKVNSSLLLN